MSGSETLAPIRGNQSWKQLLSPIVAQTQQVPSLCKQDVVEADTATMVEQILGLGCNPFLMHSEFGSFRKPSGGQFDLVLSEVLLHWPRITAQAGSYAHRSGAQVTNLSDREFLGQTRTVCYLMRGGGPSLFLMLSWVTSGDLHSRIRQILLDGVCDDAQWTRLTGWQAFAQTDPEGYSEADTVRALEAAT
jgi:hypothetical protein